MDPSAAELNRNLERGLLEVKISGFSIPSSEHPQQNQDSIRIDQHRKYAMVLDGFGGHPDGDKASKTAADFISKQLESLVSNDPQFAAVKMSEYLQLVSHEVGALVPGGLTTATVTKILEHQGRKYIVGAHIGDCEASIWRNGRLHVMTRPDREPGARQNQLSQAIGENRRVNPQTFIYEVFDGDEILLNSDGVDKNLTKEQVSRMMAGFIPPGSKDKAQAIATAARMINQSPDDISAVVMQIGSKVKPKPVIEQHQGRHHVSPPTRYERPAKKSALDNIRMWWEEVKNPPYKNGHPELPHTSGNQGTISPDNYQQYGESFFKKAYKGITKWWEKVKNPHKEYTTYPLYELGRFIGLDLRLGQPIRVELPNGDQLLVGKFPFPGVEHLFGKNVVVNMQVLTETQGREGWVILDKNRLSTCIGTAHQDEGSLRLNPNGVDPDHFSVMNLEGNPNRLLVINNSRRGIKVTKWG